MALNLHGLLHGTSTLDGFHAGIEVPDEDDAVLREARDTIRATLKTSFRDISDRDALQKAFLVDSSVRWRFDTAQLQGLRITPKFRMQGSYVYRTINDPVVAHVPPQQIDLDDGVFVPTSFVNEEKPSLAAKGYFRAVEEALGPLCKARGWTMDTSKSSCVRILVGHKIHIDLPLYAIPDKDFAEIELMTKSMAGSAVTMDSVILMEEQYQSVPDDHIMLAEREGTWRKSDPRALERWFLAAVRKHGEGLRRVCRYLKAWRDHHWKEPKLGIPSITLMAMAVTTFDEATSDLPQSRDDLLMQMVADCMPDLLEEEILNPVVEGETLDGGWTPGMRSGFVEKANQLSSCLAAAVGGSSAQAAIVRMQDCLGGRVPSHLALVKTDGEEQALLATPRVYVAAPAVGRSVSG